MNFLCILYMQPASVGVFLNLLLLFFSYISVVFLVDII